MTVHEAVFNHALGAVIAERNDGWIAVPSEIAVEQTGLIRGNRALRPDILINTAVKPPLCIESEFSNFPDQDAKARLGLTLEYGRTGRNTIRIVAAVKAPKRFKALNLLDSEAALKNGGTIEYAFLSLDGDADAKTLRRFPEAGYLAGTAVDFVQTAGAMNPGTPEIEATAELIRGSIEDNVRLLGILGECTLKEIMGHMMQYTTLSGLSAANLLWLNAFLVQHSIAASRRSGGIPHIPNGQALKTWTAGKQASCWRLILERNWRNVFRPAVRALEAAAAADWKTTDEAVRALAETAQIVISKQVEREISIGAELLPKLVEARKHTAAFYTRAPSAELLAALTIRPGDTVWEDPLVLRENPVGDLACGTGTLLRAALREIQTLHRENGGTRDTARRLHRCAMEEGLYGCDISPIAVHMTTSNLAAAEPGSDYGGTKIQWTPVGGGGDLPQLGALSFMELEARNRNSGVSTAVQIPLIGATAPEGKVSSGIHAEHEAETEAAQLPPRGFGYVLMNPPYTRTHGGRNTEEKRKRSDAGGAPDADAGTGQGAFEVPGLTRLETTRCQAEWGRRIKRGKYPADKRAGFAASFTCVAIDRLKPGGRLGLVLPTTAAGAKTWEKTRRAVEKSLKDIIVIGINAARKRDAGGALSADTSLDEMLLIGKKKGGRPTAESGAETITYVTLNEAPARQGEARAAAKAILRGLKTPARNWPIRLGNSQIGTAIRCPLQDGGPWSAVGAVDGRVVAAAERLRDDGVLVDIETDEEYVLPIPMKTVEDVLKVGPTHHLIGHLEGSTEIGAYEMSPRTGTSPPQDEMSLWSVDGRRQRRMLLTATHNAVQTGTDEQKANVDAKKAHLFYQRGFRFTANAVLAAATISKIHSGRSWTALIGKSRTIERAMALWFNSTLGMILHWHAGGRQQVGRVQIQVSGIKQIPAPDLGTLSGETLKAAAAAHLRLRETALADAVVERLKVIISAPPSTVLTANRRCQRPVCGTDVCGCAAAG